MLIMIATVNEKESIATDLLLYDYPAAKLHSAWQGKIDKLQMVHHGLGRRCEQLHALSFTALYIPTLPSRLSL